MFSGLAERGAKHRRLRHERDDVGRGLSKSGPRLRGGKKKKSVLVVLVVASQLLTLPYGAFSCGRRGIRQVVWLGCWHVWDVWDVYCGSPVKQETTHRTTRPEIRMKKTRHGCVRWENQENTRYVALLIFSFTWFYRSPLPVWKRKKTICRVLKTRTRY